MTQTISDRLAVCSWSLQPKAPADLVSKLGKVGIKKVQLALDPLRTEPAIWGNAGKILSDNGVTIVSGMFGCVGEDYSTLGSIRRTGGVVPDATWPATWANIRRIVPIAASLKLKLVTFHAGFIPHNVNDPIYSKVRARISGIAEAFTEFGIELGFETGQESAAALKGFLDELGKPNVGVNFDPANVLLYASGEPIESVRSLAPHLKQCHIKDARRTKVTGTWGAEQVVGMGEVDWKQFFAALRDVNFGGYLVIEREGGDDRIGDVIHARDLVLRMGR